MLLREGIREASVRGPIDQLWALHDASNTWTEEAPPENEFVLHACAHEGRVFAFRRDGAAYSRATDGSWSLCTRAVDREHPPSTCVSGSVLLG